MLNLLNKLITSPMFTYRVRTGLGVTKDLSEAIMSLTVYLFPNLGLLAILLYGVIQSVCVLLDI